MTFTEAQKILKDLAESEYNVPRRSDPISMRKNQIYEAIMQVCQPHNGTNSYWNPHPNNLNYCMNCDCFYDSHDPDDLRCPE